jgi:hypothetical protein
MHNVHVTDMETVAQQNVDEGSTNVPVSSKANPSAKTSLQVPEDLWTALRKRALDESVIAGHSVSATSLVVKGIRLVLDRPLGEV